MSILVTHPGRSGDVLWACAVIRAIKAANPEEPIDLALSAKYGSLKPLLERQNYLGKVIVVDEWQIEESAPITPRVPPRYANHGAFQMDEYDRVIHLGYQGWPSAPLPHYVYQTVQQEYPDLPRAPLDLVSPWLKAPYVLPANDLSLGFTDEWFELKVGLKELLWNRFLATKTLVNISTSPRWTKEACQTSWDWESAAAWIATSKVFVGCCSALHVLAAGLGVPVVCVEPNPHRHNAIFYPMPEDRVLLLKGNDGKPTFDARHCGDAIEAIWQRQVEMVPL